MKLILLIFLVLLSGCVSNTKKNYYDQNVLYCEGTGVIQECRVASREEVENKLDRILNF